MTGFLAALVLAAALMHACRNAIVKVGGVQVDPVPGV